MFTWQKIIMIFTLFLLAGCENTEIKQELQAGFDKANPSGKRGICFIVGRINYPYTTKYITGEENNQSGLSAELRKERNESLNERLAMLARLELFSETPAIDDKGNATGFYQYDLTEEGKKYAAGRAGTNVRYFCFGRVVVDSVGDMYWGGDTEKRWGSQKYIFHVEGEIPKWATSPELNIIGKLSKNNEPIKWDNVNASWPYSRTSKGLKPTVSPGIYYVGI